MKQSGIRNLIIIKENLLCPQTNYSLGGDNDDDQYNYISI